MGANKGYNLVAVYAAFTAAVDNIDAVTYHNMRANSKLSANSNKAAAVYAAAEELKAGGKNIDAFIRLDRIIAANVAPVITCNECTHSTCTNGCYAVKNMLCHGYDVNKNACFKSWIHNAVLAVYDRAEYERGLIADIDSAAKRAEKRGETLHVRIHAAGDFYNYAIFKTWLNLARRFSNVRFLAFTKQYSFLDRALETGLEIPENLNLVVSVWPGLNIPAAITERFPIAVMNDGENLQHLVNSAVKCPGNCGACKLCWYLQRNTEFDAVYFDKH